MLQEASKVREEGRKSMEVAQRMQVEITQEANELEARVLLLQEKERQVADVSLLLLKPVSDALRYYRIDLKEISVKKLSKTL